MLLAYLGGSMKMPALRQVGLTIAFVAMLSRALLPDGWMPDFSTDTKMSGWFPLVICTSSGLVHLDQKPGEKRDDQTTRHLVQCPYAAASHVAVSHAPADLELYQTTFILAPPARAMDLPHERIRFERQLTRAPPFLTI